MKKFLSLVLLLGFSIIFYSELNAQFVDIGTGTTTNTTTGQAPINIYYRSIHFQVVYTAAELTASGALPGDTIYELGWYVTGVPIYNLPNYSLKLKHTSAADASVYDATGLTNVVTVPLHAPTAGGYDMTSFTNVFVWNGTSNLLVDICFDQVNPTWNSSGQVRTFAGLSRSVRSDGSSQCAVATNTNSTYRPQVRFKMSGGTPPACTPPSSLTSTLTLANSVNLTWSPGQGIFFLTEVGLAGFTPGTGASVSSTANINSSETLTGLTGSTNYDAYVTAICPSGDTLLPIGPFSFLTPCVTEIAPYYENFDATLTTPLCWTNTNLSTDSWMFFASGGTTFPSPGYGVENSVDHTSTSGNFAWIDASGNINANELISPVIDFSGLTQGIVGCWILSNNTNDIAQNTLNIEAWDGSAWVNVHSYAGNFDGWKRIYGIIPNTIPTTTQFRLVQVGSTVGGTQYFNDLLIDDFFVDEAPTCLEPTNLSVNVLSFDSAEISWTTGGANIWQIEYGVAPFAQGNGTLVSASTNPFIITGLSDNTEYYFYVQDSCSTTDVSWWATGSVFETPCITYIAPWLYEVESAVAATNGLVEDCWSSNPAGPNFTYRWNTWQPGQFTNTNTGPIDAYSGDKYFYTESSSGITGAVAELYTPFVDISALTTPRLMFQYHFYGASIDKMYIDVYDGATWTVVDSIVGQVQMSETEDWIFHSIDISSFSGAIQARFRGIRGTSFTADMSIDDIRFDNLPTCFAPTMLMDSVIDPYSASLSWTTGGASNWIIEYGPLGFIPGSGTTVTTSTIPTVITGLTPGIDYHWYVKDSCSATDLSWNSVSGDFRLPAVVFCDSINNFVYCHPDESIETYTYQSQSGSGQLHFLFNSGITGSFVDFAIYDGPDNTYPIIFIGTGADNLAGFEFTSNSSIVTFEWNSQFANVCTTPLDFDVNCCVPTTSLENVFICKDSTYMLADSVIVAGPGAYTATITNVLGCDSTITYFILELPDTVNVYDDLCSGDIYTFADGSTTNVGGSFQATVANQNGCDSTINYTIGVAMPSSSNMSGSFCQGSSYILPDGNSVSTAGNHTATITNEAGCDSVITVNLTMHLPSSSTENAEICDGDTYELPDGVIVTTSGMYTSTVLDAWGCNLHVITTNLTVNTSSSSQVLIEICGSETYTLLNGDIIDESGEYNININNAAGCDSIVTVFVSKCNAIDELDGGGVLNIFPNPASRIVNVTLNDMVVNNDVSIKIINALGQTVFLSEEILDSELKINVEDFSTGMYFIVLSDRESSSLHKFMISK